MSWFEMLKVGGAVMSSGGGTDALFGVRYGGKSFKGKKCNCKECKANKECEKCG